MSTTFNKYRKIQDAQDFILHGTIEDQEADEKRAVKLAKLLQANAIFSYARRVYQKLYLDYTKADNIVISLAICTYKDTDLSSEKKFDIAARLLIKHFGKTKQISNPHVLGILGSIYKKKWQFDNYQGHLFKALLYYQAGYEIAKKDTPQKTDFFGYCTINMAFVYDLLASDELYEINKKHDLIPELKDSPLAEIKQNYKLKAQQLRKEIDSIFSEKFKIENEKNPYQRKGINNYWFFATWAEALLGLGEFDDAKEKFKKALNPDNKKSTDDSVNPTDEWKRLSTSKQCFQLINLIFQKEKDEKTSKTYNDALSAIYQLLDVQSLPSDHDTKLGLALSGGGFRAAFFHIGVLAKLAETGLLQKVEVISCVSGGSIIGAYYYLKVKELFETNPHDQITGQNFIDIVNAIQKDFFEDVNNNVRLNVLAKLSSNFKMSFKSEYTRTSRTEELYDKFLYKKFIKKIGTLNNKKQITMGDLKINTKSYPNKNPIPHNWKHDVKVPILVLNATTLNTSHSYQFTSTYMGESPAYLDSEFDILPTFRRMYYNEAPEEFQNIPLSKAVAASAGVPGLFAPIEFKKLYKNIERVLLVDGGVHDNQGASTLYQEECNMLVISDASGQLQASPNPPKRELGVFARTNGVLQERIRYAQFKDLEARKKSGVIRDYILMHFTKDIDSKVVDWEGCHDPYMDPKELFQHNNNSSDEIKTTSYHIEEKLQKLLAGIRTDLDAFHETEVSALMYSAYAMTQFELSKTDHHFFYDKKDVDTDYNIPDWSFLKIKNYLNDKENLLSIKKIIAPSSSLFGKTFQLSSISKYLNRYTFGGIAALVLLWLVWRGNKFYTSPLFITMAIIFGIIVIDRLISRLLSLNSFLASLFLGSTFAIICSALFTTVKKMVTNWYLRLGKLPILKKEEE